MPISRPRPSDRNRAKLDAPHPVLPLPETLTGFCRYLLGEHWRVFLTLFVLGFLVAGADAMVAVFIGKLVGLVGQPDREAAWQAQWPVLVGLLLIIGLVRPVLVWLDLRWRNARLIPAVTTRMRWLAHWHVIRQRWLFFQTLSPGQLAHWVMQTPGAVREVAEAALRAVWYLSMYGLASLVLLASADWRLMLPLIGWFAGYVLLLYRFVPRMRDYANANAEQYSGLMAGLTDLYGNMLAVRLFGIAASADGPVRQALRGHEQAQTNLMGAVTRFISTLTWLNTALLVGTTLIGGWLWLHNQVAAAAVAMALPLVWQVAGTGGWVAFEIVGIYQNLGEIREGMKVIALPNPDLNAPPQPPLHINKGEIIFDKVSFAYPDGPPVIKNLSLHIAPGEKLGIVGRSGAGKSTLMHLLLGLETPQQGRILIDGQDLAHVDPQSVREQMAVVSQDTSLFHRSIRDNLLCSAPDATEAHLQAALQAVDADHFVAALSDDEGRQGLEASAGERGSRLSGGQRQRIALARAWLRPSPILVLDEASSALDSATESDVMSSLQAVWSGKTVLSIAHRLSALQAMDKILVLDDGQVKEAGTHAQLLAQDGLYATLWRHQAQHRDKNHETPS